MSHGIPATADRAIGEIDRLIPGERFAAFGRAIALAGVILPLLLIGILKFTVIEVE